MQANCPQCSHRIVIDDAKAPDRPFNVRCPKCQNAVRFPGKAAVPAEEPAISPALAAPPPAPEPAASSEELRAQMLSQLRREMATGETAPTGEKALVALTDRAQAGALTLCLTRQGYSVETLADLEEGARLLEQGVFTVVATARTAAPQGKGESLYQRINRLPPDARRKVFVILVGNEFKTGDGTQAFAVLADLVVNAKDAGAMDGVFRNTLGERQRLYQCYLDARRRAEA